MSRKKQYFLTDHFIYDTGKLTYSLMSAEDVGTSVNEDVV